jgi:hypothetical protein
MQRGQMMTKIRKHREEMKTVRVIQRIADNIRAMKEREEEQKTKS